MGPAPGAEQDQCQAGALEQEQGAGSGEQGDCFVGPSRGLLAMTE